MEKRVPIYHQRITMAENCQRSSRGGVPSPSNQIRQRNSAAHRPSGLPGNSTFRRPQPREGGVRGFGMAERRPLIDAAIGAGDRDIPVEIRVCMYIGFVGSPEVGMRNRAALMTYYRSAKNQVFHGSPSDHPRAANMMPNSRDTAWSDWSERGSHSAAGDCAPIPEASFLILVSCFAIFCCPSIRLNW